jgi:hypothetical protein
MSRPTEDTQTLRLPLFLDHNGVLGRIHLQLLSSETIAPPRQGPADTHVPIPYPETHHGGVEIQGGDRLLRRHLTREGYDPLSNRLLVPPAWGPSSPGIQ